MNFDGWGINELGGLGGRGSWGKEGSYMAGIVR